MRFTRTSKAVAFLLLFAMFLAVVPPPAFAADTDSAEQATGESAADRTTIKAQNVEPETGQTTELPASSDPSESPASGAGPDGAPAGGLTFIKILADGSIVFDDPKQTGGSKAPPENTILYKDIFGAHGSDMSYYGIKAGGAYTANAYGANDTAWFPLSTWDGNKELSYDGYHYVCTGAMYCNRGPYSYICTEIAGAYTYLALPIRPSQEDGGDGTYSTDNYVSSTGVPTYKLEILKSKQIPAYTQDEFTTINLIGAVANGMGGMTYTGDGNLSAAGYTLIMNVVLGYIGLGSDGLFHGLPLCTTSTAVNQKMCEILVRCEIYSKEKGLTGNAGGDATLAQLKSKLNYTPTNMTGWYVKSGTATYSRVHYLQINRSQSSGNQIYIWSDNEIDFDNGQPVSLKKTSSASASVMACIQGNPRYTLRGAVYEIHQGSATGPVVETLITDANGNATGTVKYAVNTVLYAVEKTAPSGYLLNSTPVPLTVSADSSQNVFNVSDEPTFDPRAFRIKKTGTDSEYIPNTIFKADFYASTWMDSNYLQRTWYLKSDSAGIVQFDDAHLLSSYGGNSSDELFKPYTNSGVQFPLGCVYIQEIQAADGYITPVGNNAGVLIFIDQPTSGGAAEAYWGDAAGQPITTQNPKGIFRMENDSDGTVITAVNRQQTRLEIVKTSTDGKVSGISFTVEKETEVPGSWMLLGTYETDASGKILIPNLEAGQKLRITEDVPTDYICTGENPQIITLAEGLNTVSFANKPVAKLEIVKTSTDGKVSGINFQVEKEVAGSWTVLGTYETNASGKINLSDLEVGQKLRITETVPADYVCTSENPQIITLKKGLNTVSFSNKPVARLEIVKTSTDGKVSGISFKVEKEVAGSWTVLGTYETNASGKINLSDLDVGQKLRITETVPADYVCTSENPQIITLKKGLNTVSFSNKPVARLEIVKTSTDGKVSGISFKVEKEVSGSWTLLGTYKTDASGKILIPDLDVGQKLRITEQVPTGYVCTSENPQIITLQKAPAVNSVSFHNKPVRTLEIIKISPDGMVEGIQFIVFDDRSGKELGTFTTDVNGKINISGLDVGMTLKIAEIVPEGYICLSENPQTIAIEATGLNAVIFENAPIYGDLELTKVDEDYPDHKLSGAEFTVTMTKPDGSTETAVMEEVKDAGGKGTGVYRLNHIAYGTVCKVKETKAPEGYLLSDEEFEVTIQEQKTYVIKDKDFDSVTNRRIYGDLELTKVDEDYPDHKLSGAEFTVTMTKPDGSTETAVMEEVKDADGKGTGVYRLNHIAYGTVCKVKETKAPEGYLLSDEEFEVTIQEQKTYVIKDKDFDSVTNKQMVGRILVRKENDKGQPMAGVTYRLEYSLDDTNTWLPIQFRDGDSPVQAGYSTSANIVDGCITTGEDGIAEFTGLAINNATHTIKYRLTEVKTQDGYNLLSEPVFEGFLTAEQAELTYKIVNHRVFEMPMTGSSGFTVSMLGLALSLLAAMFILFNLPKKKEEK